MYRPPPEFIYVRWIGLLCSLIPMLGFTALASSSSGLQGLVLSLIIFGPLLVSSYYLDTLMRRFPMTPRLSHPYIRFALSWIFLFPVARLLVSEPLLLVLGMPTISAIGPLTVAGFAFLGLAYGTMFYTAYIVSFRFYAKWKMKRGEMPAGFRLS